MACESMFHTFEIEFTCYHCHRTTKDRYMIGCWEKREDGRIMRRVACKDCKNPNYFGLICFTCKPGSRDEWNMGHEPTKHVSIDVRNID